MLAEVQSAIGASNMTTRPISHNRLLAGAIAFLFLAVPARADLESDFAACMYGSGKLQNGEIVDACTRLIDGAQKENEVVGLFHAMRAMAGTDSERNCADAQRAAALVEGADFKSLTQTLVGQMC